MEDKRPKIIYPLPNDNSQSPIYLGKTNEEGKFDFSMQFREVGRHTVRVGDGKGIYSDPISVQVLPDCKSKASIRQRNRMLRSSIRAALSFDEIQKHVDESKLTVDIADEHLKNDATQEYEETCGQAEKTREKLRLIERKRSISLEGEYGGGRIGGSFSSEEKKL